MRQGGGLQCENTPIKGRPQFRSIDIFLLRLMFFIMLLTVMTGCAWTDKQGTHYLIIGVGFGIVTTRNEPGVDVMDSRILGAEISPSGGGVGWMQHHRVAIDPTVASDVVVSVKRNPFGLTICNFDPYSTAIRPKAKERKGDK